MTYSNNNFIVNRNQFSGSHFIDSVTPVKTGNNLSNSYITYGNEHLLMFDLNSYLKKIFHVHDSVQADIALICPIKAIGSTFFNTLANHEEVSNASISRDFMAMRIVNNSTIDHLNLRMIQPIPVNLNSSCKKSGVLGVFFEEITMIHFFIDLEAILKKAIEEKDEYTIG
jgi:hypothetical protein